MEMHTISHVYIRILHHKLIVDISFDILQYIFSWPWAGHILKGELYGEGGGNSMYNAGIGCLYHGQQCRIWNMADNVYGTGKGWDKPLYKYKSEKF